MDSEEIENRRLAWLMPGMVLLLLAVTAAYFALIGVKWW